MNTKLHELPLEERIKLAQDLWDNIAADARKLCTARISPKLVSEHRSQIANA